MPSRRREVNIIMKLKAISVSRWNFVDWTQNWEYWRALAYAALKIQVPWS